MLEKLLQSLELGTKEQIIYKLILEHGKIAPFLLSRLAKINRTTVYSVAKELVDKGLIVEDLGGKSLYYLPVRGEGLEKLVKIEHEKVAQKEKSIQELQDFLKQMPESKTYSVPKIRFVDEADLKDYLYEATPRWIESNMATDPTWWGFQDHSFVEKHKDWIVWFWKHAPQEVNLKLFSNISPIEKDMVKEKFERREIKFWNSNDTHESTSGHEISATQWVVGDYVIYIMTKQRPFYLVEIHDGMIAHNSRELFKKLWGEK